MKKLVRLVLLVLAFVVLAECKSVSYAAGNTIKNGVFIRDIDVSGMTTAQATAAVNSRVEQMLTNGLQFKSPSGYSLELDPKDIDASWSNKNVVNTALSYGRKGNPLKRYKDTKDLLKESVHLPLEITVNKSKIVQLLEEHIDDLNQEAVDNKLVKTEDGFEVEQGHSGITIDINEAATFIKSFICDEWDGEVAALDLPSRVDEPDGTYEALCKVGDLLGTYTTSFKTSGTGRSANLVNGARLLNGITLLPGEKFSALDYLLPMDESNGYQIGGAYQNGIVVDSMGGGICQVTSTFYNAVIRAELDVVTRYNHSMIVTYVPASADAAIAISSGKTFEFINNQEYPVYIEAFTTPEKNITFNVYGVETRPANREVKFESQITERIETGEERIIADGGKPVGYTSVQSMHAGIKAQLIKKVYVDGVEESSEVLNKSNYMFQPRTLIVGTATSNPDAAAQIAEAIAAGNIDNARAVANNWGAALAAAAAAPQP